MNKKQKVEAKKLAKAIQDRVLDMIQDEVSYCEAFGGDIDFIIEAVNEVQSELKKLL